MQMFTAQEKKDLTELLQLKIGKNTLTLDGLHGYLFGLAILPHKFVMSTNLVPVIFGGTTLQVQNILDVRPLIDSLYFKLYSMFEASEDNTLKFPFDINTVDSKDIHRVREWADGFFKAGVLCNGLWHMNEEAECDLTHEQAEAEGCGGDYDVIIANFSIITTIVSPDNTVKFFTNDDPNKCPPGLRSLEYDDALSIMMLPKLVSEIQEYADDLFKPQFENQPPKLAAPLIMEKIGRNSSCPCGSGKKYKKCCGK
jgi:uncharacterized protein YecA (UPF0149 family)